MKLSTKLISIQFIFVFVLIFATIVVAYFYAIPQLNKIEKEQGIKDLYRVEHRVNQELELLAILASDWGEWDDTYAYINDLNKDYEKSNLIDNSLFELKIDFMFIVKANGAVIWKGFSEKVKNLASETLWQGNNWGKQHPIIALMQQKHRGLIGSQLGPLLVSGSKILNSQGEGESRGYIYFGKLISPELVEVFSQNLEFPLQLSIQSLLHKNEVHLLSQYKMMVHGQIKLDDSTGKFITINIEQQRPFYQQTMQAIKYGLFIILSIGLVSSVLFYYILKRLLICPILELRHQAYQFGKDRNAIPSKLLQRDDELGQLSVSLVNMARELNRSWGLLEKEKNEYMDASYTDPLTQLKNRRYLESLLSKDKTWRTPKHWSFLTLDIDHFKKINDSRGHHVGDVVLQQLSALLSDVCRSADIVFRTGGEEFVVVCEGTNQSQSCIVAERIRIAVESFDFGPADNSFKITCSIGFYSTYNNKTKVDWQAKLQLADYAMYAAKKSGRNTWVGLAKNEHYDFLPDFKLPNEISPLEYDIEDQKFLVFSSVEDFTNIRWQ
ncbi:MAG: diguanylate cyclase [Pseudomonadales bacterium]|nr:diguanylate cyclase [Pseudomonadales bacterium]